MWTPTPDPRPWVLREVKTVRQVPNEGFRRWFSSDDVELIVWYEDRQGPPTAFQLCYDIHRLSERALTWTPARGFVHSWVLGVVGAKLAYKAAPIHTGSPPLDLHHVRDLFGQAAGELPAEIADFVNIRFSRQQPACPTVADDRGARRMQAFE